MSLGLILKSRLPEKGIQCSSRELVSNGMSRVSYIAAPFSDAPYYVLFYAKDVVLGKQIVLEMG